MVRTGVAFASEEVDPAVATGQGVRIAGLWPQTLRLQLCPCFPAQHGRCHAKPSAQDVPSLLLNLMLSML